MLIFRKALMATIAGVTLSVSGQAFAKCGHEIRDESWIVTLQNENDFWTPKESDQHYTNGLRLSVTSPEAPPELLTELAEWMPFYEDGDLYDDIGQVRWNMSVGQNMYTPTDISSDQPPVGDRPWAGMTYLSGTLISDQDCALDSLEFSVGIVGPYSGAEDVQRVWHEWIGSPDPKGWDHQLRTEPVFNIYYEHKQRPEHNPGLQGDWFDVMPHVGFALGNAFTYANAGATLRIGTGLWSDYGPPRIRPNLPGSDFFRVDKDQPWGLYWFAGADARLVGHNIFLDGNTFGRNLSTVDKKPFVYDLQTGLVGHYQRMRLAYTLVRRSAEYDGQPQPDLFGAITMSFRF